MMNSMFLANYSMELIGPHGAASFVTTWLMYGKSCFLRLTTPGMS